MAAKFKRDTELDDLDFSFIAEREVLSVPKAYDLNGAPPKFRVILRSGEREIVCDRLKDIAKAKIALSFPMLVFAEKFPSQIACVAARLALLSRPIQDSPLFKGVDVDYGVTLSDVLPRVVHRDLRWFELPKGSLKRLKERRLSLDSFELQESADPGKGRMKRRRDPAILNAEGE